MSERFLVWILIMRDIVEHHGRTILLSQQSTSEELLLSLYKCISDLYLEMVSSQTFVVTSGHSSYRLPETLSGDPGSALAYACSSL